MGEHAEAVQRPHPGPGAHEPAQRPKARRTVVVQTKLQVGSVDDPAEREADRVAEEVITRMAAGGASGSPPVARSAPRIRRLASEVNHGPEGGAIDPAVESRISSRLGQGQPLPEPSRAAFEQAFGADLSAVRIHTGGEADQLNRSLNARAFTAGADIFFASGAYAPGTSAGDRVLAHELTHTVQQGAASPGDVRRMPMPQEMVAATGVEPKDDVTVGLGKLTFTKEMSAHYKAILDKLRTYSQFMALTHIGSTAAQVKADGSRIVTMLDDIVAAAMSYRREHEKDGGPVYDYCATLISHAGRERVFVKELVVMLANTPPTTLPFWISRVPQGAAVVDARLAAPGVLALAAPAHPPVGVAAGAQKTAEQVQLPSGDTARWSQDTAVANLPGPVADHLGEYGIDPDRTSQSKRSVALSRLDALLGADLNATTVLATRGGNQGMVMAEAMGKQMDAIVADSKKAVPTDRTNPGDANLQRLLSRLQLIDAIAGQVDRHQGNYFVQRDASGAVTGVTGIDLDFSFGVEGADEQFAIDKALRDPYPGMSMLVDAELAERILVVKESDLHAIWDGLLHPTEVTAAINRWHALCAILAELKSSKKLISRGDWGKKTLKKLKEEQRSYTAHAANTAEGRFYYDSGKPKPKVKAKK